MNKLSKHLQDLSDEELTDEVTAFSREYRASEFSNPHRKNCLPADIMQTVADSGELPGADFREHLLNCSPCFNEFQKIRQNASREGSAADEAGIVAKKESWFVFFLKPAFAAFAVLLVSGAAAAIIVVFYAVRDTSSSPDSGISVKKETVVNINENVRIDVSQNSETGPVIPQNKEKEPADSTHVKSKTGTNLPDSNKEKNGSGLKDNKNSARETQSNLLAKNIIKLDLSKAAVYRNDNSREMIYALPDARSKISVKLPENYPAGRYTVSLLSEFGKPLIENQIIPADGKNIRFNLDLSNKSGKARLCIAPKDEIPDCLAVTIGNKQ